MGNLLENPHPLGKSPCLTDVVIGESGRNPHPLGKVPCLTDKESDEMVYESGLFLQYLRDHIARRNS